MTNFRKTILMSLVVILLLSAAIPNAFADDIQDSGLINYVLVNVGNTIVRVDINEYSNAYLDGEGKLFDYLKGSDNAPMLFGVVSGNKYIELNNFSNAFLDSSSLGEALRNAEALDYDAIKDVKDFLGFDDDENPILEELFSDVPVINKSALEAKVAEVKALKEDDYTGATWSAVVNALTNAKAVLANEEATQEEVDNALKSLRVAVEALELRPEGPSIDAKYKAFAMLDDSGFVVVKVFNLEGAVFYNVKYNMPPNAEGKIVTAETLGLTAIGNTRGAGPIPYKYNKTITINIYDADKTPIHVFEDVELIKDAATFNNVVNNYINNYLNK